MSTFRSAKALLRCACFDRHYLCWAPLVVALEAYVRLLATCDYVFLKRKPYNWSMAATTKQLAQVS
jgi:hypothetical protein